MDCAGEPSGQSVPLEKGAHGPSANLEPGASLAPLPICRGRVPVLSFSREAILGFLPQNLAREILAGHLPFLPSPQTNEAAVVFLHLVWDPGGC